MLKLQTIVILITQHNMKHLFNKDNYFTCPTDKGYNNVTCNDQLTVCMCFKELMR